MQDEGCLTAKERRKRHRHSKRERALCDSTVVRPLPWRTWRSSASGKLPLSWMTRDAYYRLRFIATTIAAARTCTIGYWVMSEPDYAHQFACLRNDVHSTLPPPRPVKRAHCAFHVRHEGGPTSFHRIANLAHMDFDLDPTIQASPWIALALSRAT